MFSFSINFDYFADLTARSTACSVAFAAKMPITSTGAVGISISSVDKQKRVSPSIVVWIGRMQRARPSWAMPATFVACDFGHIHEIIAETNVKKVFPWFLWGVLWIQFCVQISLTKEILFGLKIEANPAIWGNTNKHTDIKISEISQLQKDKYWMIMRF